MPRKGRRARRKAKATGKPTPNQSAEFNAAFRNWENLRGPVTFEVSGVSYASAGGPTEMINISPIWELR